MAIAAGEFITAGDQLVQRYEVAASAPLALVSAVTDIPGCSVNVNAQTAGAFYLAIMTARVERSTAAGNPFGIFRLTVDGTDLTPLAPVAQPASSGVETTTISRAWSGALATAGVHTIKVRASCTTSGVWTAVAGDTGLVVLVFG